MVMIGLDEYPSDEPAAPLAEVVCGALERLPRDLTTDGLAEARVCMFGAYRWPSDWVYEDGHRVEEDPEFHEDVSIVLLAMLELITGEVSERYGSLVHYEDTPGTGR